MRIAIDILWKSLELDFYDLNYNFGSEKMKQHIFMSKTNIPRKGVLTRMLVFAYKALQNLASFFSFGESVLAPKGSVLLFAFSSNQKKALQPIVEKVEKACLVGINGHGHVEFPLFPAYVLSLPYIPVVLYKFLTSEGYKRQSFFYALDKYILTFGYYVAWRRKLKRLDPSIVIVSNDHVMWTRVLAKAASDANIPTVYMQHASVVDYFPPLSFDYAFLEGCDALDKYESSSKRSDTKVFLVGMAKYDSYTENINTSASIESLAVCTGHWIEPSDVAELISVIAERFPDLKLILRPHPSDSRRELWRDLAIEYNCDFSDSAQEGAFDYLKQVDAILAPDSSILLEAALMNVYPIYYDFLHKKIDLYGFLRNGLVEYFSDPDSLCREIEHQINSKPDIRQKARYYCATVDTQYDGRSVELIGGLIEKIRSCPESAFKGWKEIEDSDLNAYKFSSSGCPRPIRSKND